MPRRCIFCSSSPLTNEDVVSTWIRDILSSPGPQQVFEFGKFDGLQQVPRHRWQSGVVAELKVKCVCSTCNSTWMSEIETAAKPALMRLILDESSALTISDQANIGTWAVLKAMVGEFSAVTRGPVISQEDREEFFRTRTPPSHTRVHIGRYEGWRKVFLHYATSSPELDKQHAGYPYCVTFAINRLVIVITAFPLMKFRETPIEVFADDPFTIQIRPLSLGLVDWPPPNTVDDHLLIRLCPGRLIADGFIRP